MLNYIILTLSPRAHHGWWFPFSSQVIKSRSIIEIVQRVWLGERPPWTEEDWDKEFVKYKASPEWMKVNQSITKEDFKFIYAVEYGHRMWGRALGMVFAIPAGYFFLKKAISGPLTGRLSVLFLMGGAQGLVGWWMVRSGLKVGTLTSLSSHFMVFCFFLHKFVHSHETNQHFNMCDRCLMKNM